MNYISTRNKNLPVSSAMAIKTGLSADGGLFVPQVFPPITADDIAQMVDMDYTSRAQAVLGRFLTDFSLEEIRHAAEAAYGGGRFGNSAVAPVRKLGVNEYILELWHGPTCAFKDMALQILPHLLTAAMKKTGEGGPSEEDRTAVILVATSGDTGKAALEGFKDVPGTKIIVFYPSEGVSDIQKLQMITQEGENVYVAGIDGNFDDAQTGVKQIFTDESVKAKLRNYFLSSANSINWGRLVPQIVYYISAYCDMVKMKEISIGDKVNLCVPTGNFGNILAGYYAKKMGLPVRKLICASNKNNVLTDFINTGVYDRNREFYATNSPSMDILISSNLERLLFDLSGNDDCLIRELMNELNAAGRYEIPAYMKEKISAVFWAGACDDERTADQIAKTFAGYRYAVDTHTAVAINVCEQYGTVTGDRTKTIIASTASPFKFGGSVLPALGETVEGRSDFEVLEAISQRSGMEIPPALKELKDKEKRFEYVVKKDELLGVVEGFL